MTRRSTRSTLMWIVILAAGTTAATRPGDAVTDVHTELEASTPSAGDTLDVMPINVRLEFNQSVDPSVGELRITGNGNAYRLEPVSDEDDAAIVVATAPRLPRGAYRIHWRVLSPDGHAVTGTIDFVVSVGDEPVAASSVTDSAGLQAGRSEPTSPRADSSTESAELPVRLARGIGVGALLALAGWLLFAASVTPRAVDGRGLALALAVIATLGLALHLVRWIDYIAPPGLEESQSFARSALATTVGRFELLRLTAAVLATFLILLGALGWAWIPAAAGVVLSGFIGHAANEGLLTIAVKTLHLLAVAGWFGGLLVLAAGAIGSIDDPEVAGRVSRIALVSVVVVALTGLWQTLQLLPSFDLLFASAWGKLLLAKLGGLGVLVAFGAHHRLRLIPTLGDPPGALRRSVRIEAAVMVVVLVVAGFLAYAPQPGTVMALH